MPARNVALRPPRHRHEATELAQIEIADVLDERGEFRRQSKVRAAISVNGRARLASWGNPQVI
jgi:hypothetical protein